MTSSRRQLGQLGEEAASRYLEQAGYRIVERNWRCRSGEIDIIAEHSERVVFVEVRTRKLGGGFGTAAESVDRRKQLQVRSVALVYMKQTGKQNERVRFDVIAVEVNPDGIVAGCTHYEAAF